MSLLPVTCEAARACSAQKRPAKNTTKIVVHLSNPRGHTWTPRDQFSAYFAVVKHYHIAGNTVVKSCLKIRNNDDRDFSPKHSSSSSSLRLSFERWKSVREFGLCSKSLGTNWTPRQKRVQLATIDPFESIFSFGKNRNRSNRFIAIYCDLLRFFSWKSN